MHMPACKAVRCSQLVRYDQVATHLSVVDECYSSAVYMRLPVTCFSASALSRSLKLFSVLKFCRLPGTTKRPYTM